MARSGVSVEQVSYYDKGGSDISVSETLTHRALQYVCAFLSSDVAANSTPSHQ
jgi:hypothetical protein